MALVNSSMYPTSTPEATQKLQGSKASCNYRLIAGVMVTQEICTLECTFLNNPACGTCWRLILPALFHFYNTANIVRGNTDPSQGTMVIKIQAWSKNSVNCSYCQSL